MKQLITIIVLTVLAGCATISEDEYRARHDKAFECEVKGFVWVTRSKLCVTHGMYYQLRGY